MSTVFIACNHVGAGTGSAVVVDCLTRRPVRLRDAALCLVGGVVCTKADSERTLDGRHLVRFANGQTAWARPLAREPGAAA